MYVFEDRGKTRFSARLGRPHTMTFASGYRVKCHCIWLTYIYDCLFRHKKDIFTLISDKHLLLNLKFLKVRTKVLRYKVMKHHSIVSLSAN